MDKKPASEANKQSSQNLQKVGENLYRHKSTAGYYALIKRGGKQFRRSLKTSDRKLAMRGLSELRNQVGKLTISSDNNLTLEVLAKRWLDTVGHAMKSSSLKRREGCIKNLKPYFQSKAIRNITKHDLPGLTGSQIIARTLSTNASVTSCLTFAPF